MPAKDITPTDEQREKHFDAVATLGEDIHKRWPIWNELAKKEMGELSSPVMVVATHLLATGMMAMLWNQVSEGSVEEMLDQLFDLYTDPDMMKKFAELKDDKKEILAFCAKIRLEQTHVIAKRKVAN
jgi:hypothetical protein